MLWHRWHSEYLPVLTVTPKWTTGSRKIEKDDIVLLVEPNTARDHWPLSRVLKVHPSEDGRVRKVELKTQSGFLILDQ